MFMFSLLQLKRLCSWARAIAHQLLSSKPLTQSQLTKYEISGGRLDQDLL